MLKRYRFHGTLWMGLILIGWLISGCGGDLSDLLSEEGGRAIPANQAGDEQPSSGRGGSENEATAVTPTAVLPDPIFRTMADVCDVEDGTPVQVGGELEIPLFLSAFGGRYSFNLAYTDVRLRVTIGPVENRVQPLPEEFEKEDVMILTEGGAEVGHGDLIVVEGVVQLNESGCTVTVDRVNVAEPSQVVWPEPEVRTLDDVCAAADGSWIELSGRLELPTFTFDYDNRTALGLGPSDAGVRVRVGNGRSAMKPLPDNHVRSDLQVRTVADEIVGHGDWVTVIGEITTESDLCVIDTAEIRIANEVSWPPPTNAEVATVCSLPVGAWVRLTGEVRLPSFVFELNGRYRLNLQTPDGAESDVEVAVLLGDEPNQMQPLPESATATDLQILLDDGTAVANGAVLQIVGRVAETDEDGCLIDAVQLVNPAP